MNGVKKKFSDKEIYLIQYLYIPTIQNCLMYIL